MLSSRSSIQPFICEISDPSIRGFTSALLSLFFASGIALSIPASKYFGWRYVSGFFAVLMSITFFVLLWIHESPDWLLKNKKFDKAVKSLEFYKIDPKLIVYDDNKRKSMDGQEETYERLIELYRQASARRSQPIEIRQNDVSESWK